MEQVTRREVIGFRLAAHHLNQRMGQGCLADAAGTCGIQNTPPGSALLSLHARVSHVSAQLFEQSVAARKDLLQAWCMRGAPLFFPTVDTAIFTTGVLPPNEAAMRHLLLGAGPALDRLAMSVADAVALTRAAISGVLTGRRLAIGELGAETAARIAAGLPPAQRDVWLSPGPYAPGQPLGEGVVHFALRILMLQRLVCFAPRAGNKAPIVLTSEWIETPVAQADPAAARAELTRRYLHAYGPSTPSDFAAWLGVAPSDVGAWWDPIAPEAIEVAYRGRSWLLAKDLAELRAAPPPQGVRLLPPGDPYLLSRDRETLAEVARRREIWKTLGSPGAVLSDGEIVGTWRARKRGKRLELTLTPFAPWSQRSIAAMQDEAAAVASLRGASAVTVDVTTETPSNGLGAPA